MGTRRSKTAVIPLKPDFDSSKLVRVKHTISSTDDDGNYEKTSVMVPELHEDSTQYQFLHFIRQFRSAMTAMNWDTGTKCFQKFKTHLEGEFDALWDDICAELDTNSMEDFEIALLAFKAEQFEDEDYDQQMEYLRSVKKPGDVSPKRFLQLLRIQNNMLKELPNAPDALPGFTDTELRRIYLQAMPVAWQDRFENADKTVATTTLQSMRAYFEKQAAKDPYVANRNNSTNSRNTGTNRNSSNGLNNGRNNRRQGNTNNRSFGSNNRRNGDRNTQNHNFNPNNVNSYQRRVQPWDPSSRPGHQGPTWQNRRSNRFNNTNFSGNQSRNQSNNDNRNNDNTNRSRSESHANESGPAMTTCETNSSARTVHYQESHSVELVDISEAFHTCQFLDSAEPELYTLEEKNHIDLSAQGDLVPSTIMTAKQISEVKGRYLFCALFDSGGSHVMVNKRVLPQTVEVFQDKATAPFVTTQGSFNSSGFVYLYNLSFPEFGITRTVQKVKAFVFDGPHVQYDIIFGRNFLRMANIKLDFSANKAIWYETAAPFHPQGYYNSLSSRTPVLEPKTVREQQAEVMDSFYVIEGPIQESKYEKADLQDVVNQAKHLTPAQQSDLLQLLEKHSPLFSGKLGKYPFEKFEIELLSDAKPYHVKQPYSIPANQMQLVKDELDRQVKLGILERCYGTEWGMPMFIRPKKDGRIRTIADFRQLNAVIKRKPYPLPRIQDIFWRRRNYRFLSKLDISMQYYCFHLTEASSWLCILVTPFGKFRMKVLPMGLTNSPDWAQAAMERIFNDMLHEIEVYLDDIAIFSKDWPDHLRVLDSVLARLHEAGFTVNPLKCEWGVSETDFLGFYMTPTGLKPWKKKITGILNLDEPTTLKQLRAFIGMVNFYKQFFRRRAHILAPLTALTKLDKTQFKRAWGPQHSAAFKQAKAMLAQDILLQYPDPNLPYTIETDASDAQLGSVILQNDKPVAFFSRKLTGAQRNYPIPDKEALSIVETLQEFRPILFGAQLTIKTDHKNLTQPNIKSQRLLNWRLLIEEYAPHIQYIPGSANVGADVLSRFPIVEGEPSDLGLSMNMPDIDNKTREVLMNYPADVDAFPVNFDTVRAQQLIDQDLTYLLNRQDYETQTFHGIDLICKNIDGQWKVVLPEALVDDTVAWYHAVCDHAGTERLYQTITQVFFHRGLKEKIKEYVRTCAACQKHKNPGAGYGELPPRNFTELPWEVVAVDCIGPWSVSLPNIGDLTFKALTIIDVCSTISEICRLENDSAAHAWFLFETNWLSRYPRPVTVVHDLGTEFVGANFQTNLRRAGINASPTTVKNPQANAVCERLHSTIGDMLRTHLHDNPPTDVATAVEIVDSVLAAAQYAVRTAVHSTFKVSPGTIVFGRDMFLPVPMLTDFELLRTRRQALIDDNNRRENLRRNFKDYAIGDEVLVFVDRPNKMQSRTIGPFPIQIVHTNGTVSIRRSPNVLERVNIRRVRPFYRR